METIVGKSSEMNQTTVTKNMDRINIQYNSILPSQQFMASRKTDFININSL